MAKQFKNKEEMEKWIKEKDAELYPLSERDFWDISPCKMSSQEIKNALIADGYTNLDDLLESEEEYEIVGHTNVKGEVINIFKNYGCLAAEKRTIYTYGGQHHRAVCSDIISVKIPEGWKTYESASGELMITSPWGWNYQINEVLSGNEFPCFSAVDSDGRNYMARLGGVES